MLRLNEIHIRDPFVLPVRSEGKYYLYGSTDPYPSNKGGGFNAYTSADLEYWDGPYTVFHPDYEFWADRDFWAPEVHFYSDRYFMFASFRAEGKCRGTQILVSDSPKGPFKVYGDGPITPLHWECLDGTLYVDEKHDAWIIYCHEWLQIHDGEICATKLSPDLKYADGEPLILFRASEAPWTKSINTNGYDTGENNYVTDGPFIYRTNNGELLMLWSSFCENGYALGLAQSTSGTIQGPWVHEEMPLYNKDGGHGMIFRTFQGRLILTIHSPNRQPHERPIFMNIVEYKNKLVLE